MAFNKKEEEIIRWSLKNNKTPEEIQGAVTRFRTTGSPAQIVEPVGTLADIPSDIGETVSELGQTAQKTLEGTQEAIQASKAGEQSTFRGLLQGFGKIAGGLSSGVGTIFKGGVKAFLNPEQEKAIKETITPVVESAINIPAVRNLIDSYETLDEKSKRDVDALFGVGALATDLATLGIGGRGVQVGKEVAGEGVKLAGGLAKQTQELLGGVTKTGTEGIKEAITKAVSPSGIMQRVARISKPRQAKFEQIAGESVGDYLVNRGIFGNIDELTTKLHNRFTTSKKAADDALAQLKGSYNPTPVKTALNELLAHETKVSTPGALSRDFKRVRELDNKFKKEGLSMSEINETKRLYEKNVKLDFLKQNLPESVSRANNIDSAIRKWQFDNAPKIANEQGLSLKNLPDINKETRLAKQLLDDLGKEYAGSAGNNAITLSDWVILSGGDPTAIGGFLAKKTFSSKGVQSAIAKKLSGEPTVGLPKAEFGDPTIDGFLEFIKKNPPKSFKEGVTPKTKQAGFIKIPGISDDLAVEARKFKTADEFIEAQPKVFHGTNADFKNFESKFLGSANGTAPINKLGFSFTGDKSVAKTFGKNLIEAKVDIKKPFTIDAKGQSYSTFKTELNQKLENLDKSKFDGIIIKNFKDAGIKGEPILSDHYIPFSQEQIKTKSQLTDIFNKVKAKEK